MSRINNQQSRLPEDVDIRPYVAIILQAIAVTLEIVSYKREELVPIVEEMHTFMQSLPGQDDVQQQVLYRNMADEKQGGI